MPVLVKTLRFAVLMLYLPLALWAGCSGAGPDYDPEIEPGVFQFDFETGTQGWEPIFTGIPVDKENGGDYTEHVETETGHRSLPEEVDERQKALFIHGFTGSSGMGLFFKRRIEGLTPGATYQVHFEVKMATRVPSGCLGAGGGSGSTLAIAAAVATEPARTLEEGRYINTYVFEKATKEALDFPFSFSEEAPPVLGTTINGIPCGEAQDRGNPFRMKRFDSGSDFWTVRADESGRVWLLVGTWSVHQGPLSYYYDEITVRFEKREG